MVYILSAVYLFFICLRYQTEMCGIRNQSCVFIRILREKMMRVARSRAWRDLEGIIMIFSSGGHWGVFRDLKKNRKKGWHDQVCTLERSLALQSGERTGAAAWGADLRGRGSDPSKTWQCPELRWHLEANEKWQWVFGTKSEPTRLTDGMGEALDSFLDNSVDSGIICWEREHCKRNRFVGTGQVWFGTIELGVHMSHISRKVP